MREENRGFSLVEIIVVIAIMAILVGIITPAYLRYLEKTREQKDLSAAGEIYRAAEIVVYTGEYDISEQVLVTFGEDGISLSASFLSTAEAENILREHFGEQYSTAVPVSKKYRDKTYKVSIEPPEEGSEVPRLSDGWY